LTGSGYQSGKNALKTIQGPYSDSALSLVELKGLEPVPDGKNDETLLINTPPRLHTANVIDGTLRAVFALLPTFDNWSVGRVFSELKLFLKPLYNPLTPIESWIVRRLRRSGNEGERLEVVHQCYPLKVDNNSN
jgi:hypothetical protein